MKKESSLYNLFSVTTVCNLFSIILSFTVLKKSSFLIFFYAISFFLELIIFLSFIYRKKIIIEKKSLILFVIYLIIMLSPIITNAFLNINTNHYDLLSIIFKCSNYFIFYSVIKSCHINEEQIRKYMKLIIVIGVITCLYNFIFCYPDILQIFNATSSYQVNVKSFFIDRNMFGEYMLISTIACYYYFAHQGNSRKLRNPLLALFALNALMTFSRSSIFSVFLIDMYMFYAENKNSKKFILITLLLLIFTLLLFSTDIKTFIDTFIIRKENFSTGRTFIWELGFSIFKRNPINGLGYYTAVEIANGLGMSHSQFHSFFIDSLVGYGVIGLIFNIYIFISCFNLCNKKCAVKEYKRVYKISFLVILVQMFIESVSIFSVGYSDLVTTIFYISMPLLLSNLEVIK